jgi:hypothetical protein
MRRRNPSWARDRPLRARSRHSEKERDARLWSWAASPSTFPGASKCKMYPVGVIGSAASPFGLMLPTSASLTYDHRWASNNLSQLGGSVPLMPRQKKYSALSGTRGRVMTSSAIAIQPAATAARTFARRAPRRPSANLRMSSTFCAGIRFGHYGRGSGPGFVFARQDDCRAAGYSWRPERHRPDGALGRNEGMLQRVVGSKKWREGL